MFVFSHRMRGWKNNGSSDILFQSTSGLFYDHSIMKLQICSQKDSYPLL